MAEDAKKEEELGANGENKPEEVVKKPEEFIQFPPAGSTPVKVPDGQHGLVIVDGAYAEEITLQDGTGVILYVPISESMDKSKIVAAMTTNAEKVEEPEDKDKGGPVGGVVPITIPVGGETRTEGDSTEPKKEEPKKETKAKKPNEDKKKKIWVPIAIGLATLGIGAITLLWPIKETYIDTSTRIVEEVDNKKLNVFHNEDSTPQVVSAVNAYGQEKELIGRASGIGITSRKGIPDGGEELHRDEQRGVSTLGEEAEANQLISEAKEKLNQGEIEGLGMFVEGAQKKDDIYKQNASAMTDFHGGAEEALNTYPDDTTKDEIEALHIAMDTYKYQQGIAGLNAETASAIEESLEKLETGKIDSIENIQYHPDKAGNGVLSYSEVKHTVKTFEETHTRKTNLLKKLVELFRRDRSQAESVKTSETPKGQTNPGEPTKRVEPDGEKNTEDERG